MKTWKEIVMEEERILIKDFLKQISTKFKKIFINGWIDASVSTGNDPSIFLKFGVQNEDTIANLYHDIMFHRIIITGLEDNYSLTGKIKMRLLEGGSINYGSIPIGWRNKTGNDKSILKHILNYFEKMKAIAIKNKIGSVSTKS